MEERFSLRKFSLEFDSEINQIESPIGEEQIYASTSTELYSFNSDGSSLRKTVGSTEELIQFAILTSEKKIIYLSDDKFHVCDKEGRAIRTIPVEGETVLNAVNFSLSPLEDKVVFVGESAEPGPGGPEIPVHRICVLDLKAETLNLLSNSFYCTVPTLIGWLGEQLLVLNEDSSDFLLISTKNRSEQPMRIYYSSVYKGGSVESVAVSQNGKYMAFSVNYPIERVQIFIQKDRESRMICELEGEGGGLRRALLWSPNSKWLSYMNTCFPAPTLYLIPTTSEVPKPVEIETLGLDSKLVWLPKGDGLVYSEGKEIRILKNPRLAAQ